MYGGSNPPGTSKRAKSSDQKWSELLSFIDVQIVNYLAVLEKNRAGVDRSQIGEEK
ncbi:hypothetical protein NXX53_11515 [Bacteroides salyersiae]|jgi:hypothetical protein|nr:hypothetical protein [Bacteroides salyersiae]